MPTRKQLKRLTKRNRYVIVLLTSKSVYIKSLPVFALSYLLGIKLMPRIRNWKDLKFYRPDKDIRYRHIDSLFCEEVIDWDLIQAHWQDLLWVVLSNKAGKVLSSMLLRKLTSYSRKNRLYQAFRELGCIIRTVFLLQYISAANSLFTLLDQKYF